MDVTGPMHIMAGMWSAACSVAGAFAPAHIVHSILAQLEAGEEVDLIRAITYGTEAADRQNGDYHPRPRGCELEVDCGRGTALIWRTETHVVTLRTLPANDAILTIASSYEKATKRYVAAREAWNQLVSYTPSQLDMITEQLADNERVANVNELATLITVGDTRYWSVT